jgi:multidrug efflux pump subunit AcrB
MTITCTARVSISPRPSITAPVLTVTAVIPGAPTAQDDGDLRARIATGMIVVIAAHEMSQTDIMTAISTSPVSCCAKQERRCSYHHTVMAWSHAAPALTIAAAASWLISLGTTPAGAITTTSPRLLMTHRQPHSCDGRNQCGAKQGASDPGSSLAQGLEHRAGRHEEGAGT